MLLTHFAVKGIKQGRKKYKERQAEKERDMLSVQNGGVQDPSEQLDNRRRAGSHSREHELRPRRSSDSHDSSSSTKSAERALENDPGFREYMERQRHLYLQQVKSQNHNQDPPSYYASAQGSTNRAPSGYQPHSQPTGHNDSSKQRQYHELESPVSPIDSRSYPSTRPVAEIHGHQIMEADSNAIDQRQYQSRQQGNGQMNGYGEWPSRGF